MKECMGRKKLLKIVGENIKRYRKNEKLSQAAASIETDIQQANWWNYENEYSLPSVVNLERICALFGVTATDILGF